MLGKHCIEPRDQATFQPAFLILKKTHIFPQNGFDAANPFMNTIITQEGCADFIFHSVSSASRRTYGAAFVPNASFGPPLGWRGG